MISSGATPRAIQTLQPLQHEQVGEVQCQWRKRPTLLCSGFTFWRKAPQAHQSTNKHRNHHFSTLLIARLAAVSSRRLPGISNVTTLPFPQAVNIALPSCSQNAFNISIFPRLPAGISISSKGISFGKRRWYSSKPGNPRRHFCSNSN